MAQKHPRTPSHPYENNPFFIGLNGLRLFFGSAQSVAVYAIVLAVIAFLYKTAVNVADVLNNSGSPTNYRTDRQTSYDFVSQDPGRIVVAGIVIASIIFIVILIALLLNGVLEYAGARLALGKKVDLAEAFKEVLKELGGYLWMNIIMFVKIFLWSLLFIVPGIIMAVRYQLAGTVYFAEGKHGNAAIKRSLDLTRGAWFTTFAGYGLWNLMTFNVMPSVLRPGQSAILYRQLRDVTDAGTAKPPAHWLSWLTFFVPIVLMFLFILFFVFIYLVVTLAR